MTYCIAWKSESSVFMAADAAITSEDAPQVERSSFGEKHSRIGGRKDTPYVKEETLKIRTIGDCAVTFAGSVSVGRRVISDMDRAIAKGVAPVESFKAATTSNDPNGRVQMILAYRHDGTPMLATYNVQEDRLVLPDVKLAQCGSMKSGYHELTSKYIDAFLAIRDAPHRILIQALGLLQSYGIHDYLIEHGVGGGFCGLYLDKEGLHWQPDILYVVAHPELQDVGMVGSFARDNVWCLFSSMTTVGAITFAYKQIGESGELYRQRVSPITRILEEKHDRCDFDYAVFLSSGKHSVTVVELLGHQEHDLLIVKPHPGSEASVGIYWSPQLQDMLDEITEPENYSGLPHDITVRFIPYRQMNSPLPSELRDELRMEWEIRQGNQLGKKDTGSG
jgi:hypothetical protein